jgi:hypothetical protein
MLVVVGRELRPQGPLVEAGSHESQMLGYRRIGAGTGKSQAESGLPAQV